MDQLSCVCPIKQDTADQKTHNNNNNNNTGHKHVCTQSDTGLAGTNSIGF